MRCADQIFPTQTNKIVLIVIRETKHFVRNDMPHIDDEVPILFHQHGVERDRNWPIGDASGYFFYVVARYFANMRNAISPIMCVNSLVRNVTKHLTILFRRVRFVLS